jgi:hypothetical protein
MAAEKSAETLESDQHWTLPSGERLNHTLINTPENPRTAITFM